MSADSGRLELHLTAQDPSDNDAQFTSNEAIRGGHGLCNKCKILDFGKHMHDPEHPGFPNLSRQFQVPREFRPPHCRMCAERVRLLDGYPSPHEVCRYVPLIIDHANNADGLSRSSSLIDKLIHFKRDGVSLQDIENGWYRCISTSKHTFTPISVADSASLEELFGLERADLPLAKAWYNYCHSHHETTCEFKSNAVIPYFKVIDCSTGKVCDATAGHPYIALSYVWGQSTMNWHEDPHKVSLGFPKTVQDAMVVATELGVPYLWVDRYCIDQSNEREKHNLISNMNSIYSGAEVTIIAAAGLDPHYGLPGVSETSRKGRFEITFDGGYLVGCPDAFEEVAAHPWITRGWM
jgi:hypothetical protein